MACSCIHSKKWGWDVGSWREGVRDGAVWVRGWPELPGAAGVMCLPHAPPQLPEQDLARTREGTEAFSLQVQNSNLILQVQNLDLRSKIFFALLVWVDSCPPQRVSPSTSYLQNSTSLQGRHSRGAAALQWVCGSTGEARGPGTAAVSLWGTCPSTTPNAGLILQLSVIILLLLCAEEQGNIHLSTKRAWPQAPELLLSGMNKGWSARPTAPFSPSPLGTAQICRNRLSLGWRTKRGSVPDSIKPRGTPAEKASLKQKGTKRECFTAAGHRD